MMGMTGTKQIAFRLTADAEFQAEDLGDAFRRIGEYYLALAALYADDDDGEWPDILWDAGNAHIEPRDATEVVE